MTETTRPAGRGNAGAGAAKGNGRGNGGNHSYSYSSTSDNGAQGPAHGKVVGNVWRKQVKKSLHLRRAPFVGWAVDVADAWACRDRGDVDIIELDEREEHHVYRARLDTMLTKGKEFDYGCGRQICLSVGLWVIDGWPKAPESKPQPEASTTQDRLF